jgi:MFS family permease
MQKQTLKLIAILINQFYSSGVYTMVAPFFPTELADNKGISLSTISFIFAIYPIISFIVSPLLGKYLNKIGRKTTFIAGMFIESVALFLISIVPWVDATGAIISSTLARALMGVAYSCIMVSSFALVSSEFPDNVQKVLGVMEAIGGIGLILGPVWGAGLYYLTNFFGTFFITGVIYVILTPICYCIMDSDREYVQKQKSSVWQLFKFRSVMCNSFAIFAFNFSLSFIYPLLSMHLKHGYGQSEESIAFLFVIVSVSYALIAPGVSLIKFEKAIMILLGCFTMASGMFVMGPWSKLPLPHELYVVVIGFVMFGSGCAMAYVLTLPSMIQRVENEEGLVADDIVLDGLSAILTTSCSVGQIAGPVISGAIIEFLDFADAAAVVGSLDILIGVHYMIFMLIFRKPQIKKDLLLNGESTENSSEMTELKS